MKNGNVVTTEYGYEAQTGWLETIDVDNNSGLLHYLDVSHDDRGNVTSRRSNYASSTVIGSDFTETCGFSSIRGLTMFSNASYCHVLFRLLATILNIQFILEDHSFFNM